MARATVFELEAAIKELRSGWVTDALEAGENVEEPSVSVYPKPCEYCAYDLFPIGNTLEIWIDGFKRKTIRSIQDANKAAEEAISFIEESEKKVHADEL